MVQNGQEFPNNFDTDSMDLDDIEVSGVDNNTPLVAQPTISITTEDTESYKSLTPDFTPVYDTQDSITVTMEDKGRPLSVSEMRGEHRPRPPPRSKTIDGRGNDRHKGDHPHFSIKMSPQFNNKKRMSFLYKPQMEFTGVNSRSQSLVSNSSFHSAIFDNILTPFARVVMHMKHIRDSLSTLEKNIDLTDPNEAGNSEQVSRMQVNNLYLLHNSLQEIDDCLEIVESLESGKSIGESAGDKFRQILQMELQHMAPSPANARVAEWVVSEFVEQDNDINGFISEDCNLDTSMYQICPIEPAGRKMSGLTNSISAPVFEAKRASIPKQVQSKSDIRSNPELLSYIRDNVENWNVDIFKINQLSQGYPLTACAYVTMQTHDLFKQCKIDESTFIHYTTDVENAYRDNPYHNGLHAADVVLNANILLSSDNLACVLQDWMVLGLIIAAAIHDCDHPGRSNKFLISTKSDLALVYNDESVLENHHCATGFKLLQKSRNNIFANFSNKAYTMIRRLIIDLVLATDMSKHLIIIGKLKTTIEYFKIKEREEVEMSSSNLTDILHALLHCADLGNPAKPRDIAIEWSRRLEEECYKQGDEERQLGIEISHMCDRENPIFEKNQYSFLTFVALPLWESWAELVYPHATIMLEHLLDNKEYWESVQPLTPTETDNDTTISRLDEV